MKKFTCCLTAAAFVVGMLAITTNAAPPNLTQKQKRISAESPIPQFRPSSPVQNAGVVENTGFEAADGWVPRDGAGNTGTICGPGFNACASPVSGVCPDPGGNCCADDPNPDTGWYISISSAHCTEPHIDTINPAAGGEQHLRFQRSASEADGHYGPPPGCVGFPDGTIGGECRTTAFTPGVGGGAQLPVGNDEVEFDIAGSGRGSSTFIAWFINDPNPQSTVIQLNFDYYGNIYISQFVAGVETYVPSGPWTTGAYKHVRVDFRNCDNVVDYYYGGALIQSFPIDTNSGGNLAGINRAILMTDNAGEIWDIDNFEINRGDPCPTTCGADGLEPGEQCDNNGEDADAACPGLCVEPGQFGANGQPECTCEIPGQDSCDAVELVQGNVDYGQTGGWFTFIATSTAHAVDMCEDLAYDSYLAFIYNPDFVEDAPGTEACDLANLYFHGPSGGANDDCYPGYPGLDPLAPCYPLVSPPWSPCGCMPVVVGERYWVWERRLSSVANRTVNMTKRFSCDAIWENGACCRGATGTCEEDIAEADCGPFDIYTHNKACGSQPACEPGPGACCDRLSGSCINGVLQADCSGSHDTWTLGLSCTQTGCDPDTGACCNTRFGTCTPGSTLADCTGENLSWTKAEGCNETTCPDPFIPTVSQWGLVIMTLMLLIGAKVYFGRREALA